MFLRNSSWLIILVALSRISVGYCGDVVLSLDAGFTVHKKFGKTICEDVVCFDTTSANAHVGLFDGHGGSGAAEIARDKLFAFLAMHRGDDVGVVTEDAIRSAFLDTQKSIVASQRVDCGSTAVIATFSWDAALERHIVHVANAGDSHAVLASRDEDGGISALRLSTSHRPDNVDELNRLLPLKENKLSPRKNIVKRKRSDDHSRPAATNLRSQSRLRYLQNENCGLLSQGNKRRRLFDGLGADDECALFNDFLHRAPRCSDENHLAIVPTPLRDAEKENSDVIHPNLEIVHGEHKASPRALKSVVPTIAEQVHGNDPLKWSTRTGLEITRGFGHHNLYRRGFSENPSIVSLPLEPCHAFLVLMSDGVHEHISDADAATLVSRGLEKDMPLDDIAKQVIEAAARTHDKTSIVDEHDPAHLRRMRDDMSVVIVVPTLKSI